MKGNVHCGNPESLQNIGMNIFYNKKIAEDNLYFNHNPNEEVEIEYDDDIKI